MTVVFDLARFMVDLLAAVADFVLWLGILAIKYRGQIVAVLVTGVWFVAAACVIARALLLIDDDQDDFKANESDLAGSADAATDEAAVSTSTVGG